MYFVAITSNPYARPRFVDADTLDTARTVAEEQRRKLTSGLASVVWQEIEPDVWATRNPDGSARFDTMYVEIGHD